jgi:Tol biopolymer transport system component
MDRPDAPGPRGIWGVNVSGGEPQFVTDRVGVPSPDWTLVAYPEGGQTFVERLALPRGGASRSEVEGGGERWVIANAAGRAVSFSQDGRLILWQAASSSENFDRRVVEVWVANVDGSESRVAARLIGGGVSGWFPGGERVLVSGRASLSDDPFLAAFNLSDGSLTVVARGARLRGGTLSPDGGWVACQITFSGDAAQDGLWVARTDGGEARRLEVFGAYRWRSEGKLWVIPLEALTSAASHRLLEVEAASGAVRALTNPAITPFRVAGGDWSPSPDGRRVVFVSADDHNLWVIDLPPS